MNGWIDGPVLGLETSGRLTGVALVRDGRLVAETSADLRDRAEEMLLEFVRRVLAEDRLAPRDLARIGVAIGPGSFTGIRIGMAAARALALGSGTAAVGVPSHEALAWPWKDSEATLVLLSAFRRGEVCLEAGRWDGDVWAPLIPLENTPMAEVAPKVRALAVRGRLIFTGEAVEFVHGIHPELKQMGLILTDRLAFHRRPGLIALLAARRDAVERRGEDLEKLEPLYVRGADARRPDAR